MSETSNIRSSNQLFVDADFDVRVHKIKNLTAGTATGHATEFDQVNLAIKTAVDPILATIHAPVATATAAKAIAAAERANAQTMLIEALGLFWYDADNASASNDDTFIRPTDVSSDAVAGRWVRHYQTKLYQPNGVNPFVYTDNSGQLHIDGNIIQSGTNYITHAEHIYTTKDLIILRENAIAGLANGAYVGFKAKLYDGVNDGHLVFDNTGTARVGDVGSEQPIATRIETPTNGHYAVWESANSRLNFAAAGLAAIGNGTAQYQVPVTGATTFTPAWTTAANLFGISGLNALTWAAASFVKMTAANTFELRTLAQTLSDIGAAPASGSNSYIQNQTSALQTASFWTLGGKFSLPSIGSGSLIEIGNAGSGVFGGLAITDGGTYPVKMWGSEIQLLSGNSSLASATTRLTISSSGTFTLANLSGTGTRLVTATSAGLLGSSTALSFIGDDYIKNQYSSAQTGTFWINGKFRTDDKSDSGLGGGIILGGGYAGLRVASSDNSFNIDTYGAPSYNALKILQSGAATFASTVTATEGIFRSTGYSNIINDSTNTSGWGGNIAFRSQGVDFGYVGSLGSLLGNTTKDMTIWATSGNGFRVYTNGNNKQLEITTTGAATFASTIRASDEIRTAGTNAGLWFNDRTTSDAWGWYSYGGTAYLYNAGNRIGVSNTGAVTIGNLSGTGTRLVIATSAGLLGYSSAYDFGIPTGSGTTNYIPKWTGAGTLGNSLIYDNGTNVGIGTATPTVRLQIFGTAGLPVASGSTQTGIARFSASYGGDNDASATLDIGSHNSTGAGWIQATDRLNLASNYALLLNPNGGSVGIGTVSPVSTLNVYGTDGITWGAGSENSSRGLVTIGHSYLGGSLFVRTPSLNTHVHQSGLGITGSFSGYKSVINITAYGIYSGSYGSDLAFSTTESATLTEWLRITNTGNVGIGTTAPGAKLTVIGESRFGTATDGISIEDSGLGYAQITGVDTGNSVFNPIYLRTGSTLGTGVYIKTDGKVGIGITNPDHLIHVQGASDPVIAVGTDSGNKVWMRWNTTGKYADFGTRESSTYYANTLVLKAGNVGIGTVSPAYRFVVQSPTQAAGGDLFVDTSNGASQVVVGRLSGTSGDNTIFRIQDRVGTNKFYVASGSGVDSYFSSGSVGIGTTSPSNKLHVEGTGGGSAGIYLNSASPATATYTLYNNGGNLYWNGNLLSTGSGSAITGSGTANYLTKWTSASVLGSSIVYDNGTNVGIGTTSPATKLDINGAISIANGDNLTWGGAYGANIPTIVGVSGTGSHLRFYPAGSSSGEQVRITEGGSVGIGTTNPSYKLHSYTAGVNIIASEGNGSSDYVEGAFLAKSNASARGAGLFMSNVAGTNNWFAGQSYQNPHKFSINYASGSFSTATADIANAKLTVLHTGEVGIGTVSPSSQLEVYHANTAIAEIHGATSASARAAILSLVGTQTDRAQGVLITSGGTESWFYGKPYDNAGYTIGYHATASEYLANSKLYIKTDGSVGIGTTNPTASFGRYLDISDASSAAISFTRTGATAQKYTIGTNISGQLGFYDETASVYRIVIAPTSGNVGIGTTNPLATLYVARGTGSQGTAAFMGTDIGSYFNYSTAEDTYIRGGKSTSKVYINDGMTGTVYLGSTSALTNIPSLTASKLVFTDASKNLTSTGIGTSSQFIKGDGSLDGTTYAAASGSASYIQNQSASAQSASAWINGTLKLGSLQALLANSDVTWDGSSIFMEAGTRIGLRSGTDYSFNLDTYNGGSKINALKILQSGASTFSSSVTAASFTSGNIYIGGNEIRNSGSALYIQYSATNTVNFFNGAATLTYTGNLSTAGSGTFTGGGFDSLRSKKHLNHQWTGEALTEISKFKLRDFYYLNQMGYNRTLGFIIDEIPESISDYVLFGEKRTAINLYSLHALSFKAHQETISEVDLLKKRVRELELKLESHGI